MFSITQPLLLSLKKSQARYKERGLVIPNERRINIYGAFSGATPRAEAHFYLSSVISAIAPALPYYCPSLDIICLCRMTTPRLLCLAEQKMEFGRSGGVIENTS